MTAPVRGTCLCGEVRYEAIGPLGPMWYCHCQRCRKASSVAFATWLETPSDGFHWLAGEDRVTHYVSSSNLFRAFCSDCGSVLPARQEATNQMLLPAGGLQSDPGLRPSFHTFVESKAPWFEITDDLPRFAGAREQGGLMTSSTRDGTMPVDSPIESSAAPITGSCLCGAIAYEVTGPYEGLRACHCSRCRQGSGSAYFTCLPGQKKNLRFLRGEGSERVFSLPDAQYYVCRFCPICGTGVPGKVSGTPRIFIAAGALDGYPGDRIHCHIFCGSKAPWFELSDDLPHFDEYPPADYDWR